MVEVELSGQVGTPDRDRRRGIQSAVVEPVREHQQIAGEPVTTDVGDLPGLLRVGGRQRCGDRPSALRATRVVAAMRADAEKTALGCREAG